LRRTARAFARVRLLPKVLVNVAQVEPTRKHFDKKGNNLPLAIAPTGGISAGRYGAELILARRGEGLGVPFTMATPSAFSIERLAEEVGRAAWFQLYAYATWTSEENVVGSRRKTRATRHSRHGGPAGVGEARARPAHTASTRPTARTGATSKDVIFKPAWALDMLRNGLPGMANMRGYRFSAAAGTDIVTRSGARWTPDSTGNTSSSCANQCRASCS
jgi:hypothetical protein